MLVEEVYLEPVYHLLMVMSEITLPHLQNMLQKAVCRTCPKKQFRKKKSYKTLKRS